MARKTAEAEQTQEQITAEMIDELTPDLELQRICEEVGDEDRAKVRIERLETKDGREKYVFLCEVPASAFSITKIQNRYGAGDYRFIVYATDAMGNYGIRKKPIVSIGEPLEKEAPAVSAAPAQDIAASVANALAPVLNAMVQVVQQATRQPSRAETLAELAQMRDIFMPQGAGNSQAIAPVIPPQKTLIEQIQEIKAITTLLKGDPLPTDDEGNVDSGTLLLSKGMDTFAKVLEMAKGSQPASVAANPIAITDQRQPVAPSAEEQEMSLLISGLLFAAKHNADVNTFAKTAYDKLPDEMFNALLDDNLWWPMLIQVIPQAAAHKEWFTKLRARILEIDSEPDDDASAVPKNLTSAHDAGIQSAPITNGAARDNTSGVGS